MAETPIVYSTEGAAGKPVVVVHGGAGRRRHPFTPEREQQAAADIKCALDAAMAGRGSNSCGPVLAERYQVAERDLALTLTRRPNCKENQR